MVEERRCLPERTLHVNVLAEAPENDLGMG